MYKACAKEMNGIRKNLQHSCFYTRSFKSLEMYDCENMKFLQKILRNTLTTALQKINELTLSFLLIL